MLLQYRAAAIAGFVTQMFWGSIKIMIFVAFYAASGSDEHPMSLAAVITYVWLGQALLGILPRNIDQEIRELVRSGGVA
jgi:ABC-2 type transport system permease protein